MMKYEISLLSRQEYNLWNDYVDQHPQGTVFHKTHWLELLNPSVEVYAALVDGRIYGGVGLIKTRKRGVTGYHRPQFAQYFSPLFGNPEVTKYSLNKEHQFIEQLLKKLPKVGHYEFKFHWGHHSILPYHWHGYTSEIGIDHLKYVTENDPMDDFSSNKRRELKKLLELKNNGVVRVINRPDEEEVWQIVREHAARKDFMRERGVFSKIFNPDLDFIHSIGLQHETGGLVSVAICTVDNKAMYNLINASKSDVAADVKTLSLLLLYELLLEASKRELIFDFEGSMLRGVEFFYRDLGGEQVGIYGIQKSPSLLFSMIRALKQVRNDRS